MSTSYLLSWEQIKKQLDMLPDHCFTNCGIVLTMLTVDRALNEHSSKDIISYINERSQNAFPVAVLTYQFNLLVVVPGWFYRGVLFTLVNNFCSRPTFDQYIIRQLIASGKQFMHNVKVQAHVIENIIRHVLGGYIVTIDGMYFIHSGSISFSGMFGYAKVNNTSSKFTATDSAILSRYLKLVLPAHDVPNSTIMLFAKSLDRLELMV